MLSLKQPNCGFSLWIIICLISILRVLQTIASLENVRIEEIPFTAGAAARPAAGEHRTSLLSSSSSSSSAGIYALGKRLEQNRGFLHIFKIPYIICFFAAKGKWPFIPTFMQNNVDAAARTLFSQNDTFIKKFCQKWIKIKECFRPDFSITTTAASLEVITAERRCQCSKNANVAPMVYFDRDHIGNVSADTIRDTIEFLENFLPPPPTKKPKRKNRVRSRIDEMEIE